ncbi:MAG: 1-phosphofructokinase family hexose kinase [Lentisphaerae bacterium]|nr:1-phosphofructokinase family hexose kinase [Lentisphaerota bacterium]
MPETGDILTVTLNPAVDRLIKIDRLVPGGHGCCETTQRTPGGKGVNVSRVLAQMAMPSVATGFLGEDNQAVFEPLFGEQVTDAFVRLPGSTRENITLSDRSTGQETHLRDRGLGVGQDDLARLREILAARVGAGSVVAFSGSLPPGVAPDAFGALVDESIERGARVVVDSSGAALREMVGKSVWLIKPNALELAELVGHALPSLEAQLDAARQLTDHISMVLLSCGGEGACLVRASGSLHASVALQRPVRNSVGCGDALLAGFIGRWRDGGAEEALADAVAIASASAAHPVSAVFDPLLAAALRSEVKIREL